MSLRNSGYITRADLIDNVRKSIGGSKRQAETIVDSMFEAIADSLRRGEVVIIHGLGSFRIRLRRGRTGRNPRTGVRVEVPPKSIVYFRASAKLLRTINSAQEATPEDD